MFVSFRTFIALIAITGLLSILDSWIIQSTLNGGIDVFRAGFQLLLIAVVLYLLWGRTNASYMLAIVYVCGNALDYAYELFQFFVLGNARATLPMGAVVLSLALIAGALLSLIVLGLDYAKYRANLNQQM